MIPAKASMLPLQRKGAWLIADHAPGKTERWQMAAVHGPIEIEGDERQYFRVETSCREILLISRSPGEKGMRQLRLDSVITPLKRDKSQPVEERIKETLSDEQKTVA